MADAAPPDITAYQPPPDFAYRQSQISDAYNAAVARTKLLRSNLYTNAGFKDGTTELDPTNRYGGIQQLLHQEGEQLTADDAAEAHRGLNSDSGLGAQNANKIRYQEHLGASNIGNTLMQGVADYGNQDASALATRNTDTTGNQTDEANYNSSQNAYKDALASYLKQVTAAQAIATPPGSTPETANWNDNPGGYNPLAPQNRGSNPVTKSASKPKAGKVTVVHAQ